MLYSELCTCKVVMRETTGGRAGTQPAARSSPFVLPSPRRLKKEEKQPKLFQHHELYCCICLSIAEVCATIATAHSNATAFSFRPYTVRALLTTKGNCTLKCIQLCVLIFFSWHIFTKKVWPWSNHDAAERPDWATHMYVCCTQTGVGVLTPLFRYHMI